MDALVAPTPPKLRAPQPCATPLPHRYAPCPSVAPYTAAARPAPYPGRRPRATTPPPCHRLLSWARARSWPLASGDGASMSWSSELRPRGWMSSRRLARARRLGRRHLVQRALRPAPHLPVAAASSTPRSAWAASSARARTATRAPSRIAQGRAHPRHARRECDGLGRVVGCVRTHPHRR